MTILTILSLALIVHMLVIGTSWALSKQARQGLPKKYLTCFGVSYIFAIGFMTFTFTEPTVEVVSYEPVPVKEKQYVINTDKDVPTLITESKVFCEKTTVIVGQTNQDIVINIFINGAPVVERVDMKYCGELPWSKY